MGSQEQPKTVVHFSRRKTILFQVTISLLSLLVIEIGLRVGGFEYHNIPRYVQFAHDKYMNQGRSEGHYDLVPDTQLFWRLAPNNPRLLTNAHGYRGDDFVDRKSPGTIRIITLGCSCTFGIASAYSYAMALQQLLNRNEAGKRYEVINAGVPGYSSFQGVKVLESELVEYRPDIVTVFFGWNDHWLAKYFQDKDQKTPSRTAQFLLDHASRLRLIQALERLSASIHGLGRKHGTSEMYRVSPQDYRLNLERIIDDAETCGSKVALVTAPTAFSQPSDVPDYLVEDGFIADKATLFRIHREYNDIVREVARSKSVLLIDCAAGFDASPKKKALFGEDGIHPNEAGHWLIALKVFRGFLRQGWIDRGDYGDLEDDANTGPGSEHGQARTPGQRPKN